MRYEDSFFNQRLVKEVMGMQHHQAAGNQNVSSQIPLLVCCIWIIQQHLSHLCVHLKGDEHLMVNLSIKSFQQLVGLLLLLQIDIGRNVSEIDQKTLLLVESHWYPVDDDGL